MSAGDLRAAVLAPLRRRGTTVLMPPEAFGGGNLLYFWLQAAARRARGEAAAVRSTARSAEWAAVLAVDELAVRPEDVRFTSPREAHSAYQRLGTDFTVEELGAFLDRHVLGGAFAGLVAASPPVADLTINVRRGDYYSVPAFRGRYAFDVVEYVGVALAAARERAEVRSVLLVSDDLDWCRLKLARVLDGIDVRVPAPGTLATAQLALLAASPRLVLANSTFSYWGGYLSAHLHRTAEVHAPWFHSREWDGGAATQLHPRWSVIRDLPGGWDG
ncbi:alpha-1,2-fucosyltransferase [Rathayibacter sp. VKM Ac-2760]|uniref:alpha-1,2-fucosyltransferase n=1 Tax=Rathayibacter sp. VKM Ac-2760 TaxID=2609253 RepID=UPI001316A659|nr:alpha-1,2-fucosyltransferase [Rathayibacter sp. VKM Ac-2760]QHC60055.1 hypothetical protein GSU72_16975 [Rathayibacter sp. VKM Ac-2760]